MEAAVKMNSKKQILLGTVISYIQGILSALIGVIFIPILLNCLSDSEYAVYQFMSSFYSIFLIDCGLTATITRTYAKYEALDDKSKRDNIMSMSCVIYSVIIFFILLLCIIIYFTMDGVFPSFSSDEIASSRKILVVIGINSVIVIISNLCLAVIQAKEKFIYIKTVLLARTVILPLVAVVLLTQSGKAISYYTAQLILSVLVLVLYLLYCLKNFSVRINFKCFDTDLLKEICGFAVFLFLNQIVDEFYWRTDSLILGAVSGSFYVALNGTASIIVTQYRSFSSLIHGMFLPHLTKQLLKDSNDMEQVNFLFRKISKIQYFIVALIFTGFMIFGKSFIALWAGDVYKDAYILALIPMAALIIPLTQNFAISVLRAVDRQKFRTVFLLASAVLNFSVSIPAAMKWNALGVNWVTAIFLLFGNAVVMNIYYHKVIHLDIKGYWHDLLKLFIPTLICVAAGFLLHSAASFNVSWRSLFVQITVYMVIYMLIMFLFGTDKIEKQELRKLLNRVTKR